MTKKRFIKKCMSCGFSRNEARKLCDYMRVRNSERKEFNHYCKTHENNIRVTNIDYLTLYTFRKSALRRIKYDPEVNRKRRQ